MKKPEMAILTKQKSIARLTKKYDHPWSGAKLHFPGYMGAKSSPF